MAMTNIPPSRLVAACESSYGRLAAAERAGPDHDPYQSLGEALFWLYALADDLGHKNHRLIKGLTWARDRIGHGLVVVAPAEHNAAGGYAGGTYGGGPYGGWTELTWLPRGRIPVSPRSQKRPAQESAYDQNVANRSVLLTMQTALRHLGANV